MINSYSDHPCLFYGSKFGDGKPSKISIISYHLLYLIGCGLLGTFHNYLKRGLLRDKTVAVLKQKISVAIQKFCLGQD